MNKNTTNKPNLSFFLLCWSYERTKIVEINLLFIFSLRFSQLQQVALVQLNSIFVCMCHVIWLRFRFVPPLLLRRRFLMYIFISFLLLHKNTYGSFLFFTVWLCVLVAFFVNWHMNCQTRAVRRNSISFRFFLYVRINCVCMECLLLLLLQFVFFFVVRIRRTFVVHSIFGRFISRKCFWWNSYDWTFKFAIETKIKFKPAQIF